jgi:hypothetical protein
VPHPIKLQAQHREYFPLDAPITEAAGERLGAWAHGAPGAAPGWAERIAAARSREALEEVGAGLLAAKESMPPGVLATLRAAYAARLKKFPRPKKTGPSSPEETTADDIRWG